MLQKPGYSRRSLSRLQDLRDIWVCCHCNGRDDISRVLDISLGGLFVAASHPKVAIGMPAKLDFLVEEGRIRADAVIRHIRKGMGLGLKLTAVPDPDSLRFKFLLARLARANRP
jgi:hypothetical protein